MNIVNYPCVFKGDSGNHVSFFLAGNITPWRATVISRMTSDKFYKSVVVDPTFAQYDVVKNTLWEFNVMKKIDCVVFWLGKETLAPVTLFNLGCVARDHMSDMVIAIDPEYQKRSDIVEQIKLFRPEVTIHETLDELLKEMENYMEKCSGIPKNSNNIFDTKQTGGTDQTLRGPDSWV